MVEKRRKLASMPPEIKNNKINWFDLTCLVQFLSVKNKVLLYKTVLPPILLYAARVWGSATNTTIQKVQTLQNKFLRSTCKFPWYIRNQTIHNTLKVDPIRKVIKNFSQNFYNNITAIPNPELFNLPDYDPRQFYKCPKASAFISIRINYK